MQPAVGGFTSEAGRAAFMRAHDEAMRRLPAPEASFEVATSFGTVRAWRFAGPGDTPLVLLPGKASSTPLWAGNLPGLQALAPVVALDLLGEPGLSVQTRPITTASEQAQWLDEALAGLGIARAHVLGVSFGGWSAVNLAIHRPQRVASVIALDPALTFGPIGAKVVLFSVLALPFMPRRVRSFALSWIAGGARAAEDSAEGRLIEVGMRVYKSRLPMPTYPTDASLRSVTVPALVVIAGRSIIHDPPRAAARARLLPRAQVELWPDASHALTGEYPERIALAVAGFLARQSAGAP